MLHFNLELGLERQLRQEQIRVQAFQRVIDAKSRSELQGGGGEYSLYDPTTKTFSVQQIPLEQTQATFKSLKEVAKANVQHLYLQLGQLNVFITTYQEKEQKLMTLSPSAQSFLSNPDSFSRKATHILDQQKNNLREFEKDEEPDILLEEEVEFLKKQIKKLQGIQKKLESQGALSHNLKEKLGAIISKYEERKREFEASLDELDLLDMEDM